MGIGRPEEFRDGGGGNPRLCGRLRHWFGFVDEARPRYSTRRARWLGCCLAVWSYWKVTLVTIPLAIFSLGFCFAACDSGSAYVRVLSQTRH